MKFLDVMSFFILMLPVVESRALVCSRPKSLLEDMTTQRCRAACGKLAHAVLGCDKVGALALCSSGCHGTNTTYVTGRVAHFSSEHKFQGH